MKKPLTMPQEAQPRNITRADLVLAEGFGLEVDGRMKTVFPTLAAAQKTARDLEGESPARRCTVHDPGKQSRQAPARDSQGVGICSAPPAPRRRRCPRSRSSQ